MKNKTNKSNANIKKMYIEFSDPALTNYSGIVPVADFLFDKLNFKEEIENELDLGTGINAIYKDHQIVSATIFSYLCNFKRLSQFAEFTKDKIVQKLLGISNHIDENTFGYRMKKFTFKTTNQLTTLFGDISSKIHGKIKFDRKKMEIIDLDSTVKGVYGNQEGATKGYNNKKRGQKSYHPLMAFLVSTKECIHSWFRPGDTYTGNCVAEFIKECNELLPKQPKGFLFRADSGFFSESFSLVKLKTKAIITW